MMTATYLLNVVLMLVLVAGMAVGAIWLTRKFQPGLGGIGRERLVRVVDAVPMGMTGSRLAVVEFEGRRLLVGVSRGRMDLIAESRGDYVQTDYIDDGE